MDTIYNGQGFSADLDYVPTTDGSVWFKLSGANAVSDSAPFSSCIPASLSQNFYISMPEVTVGANSYSVSMVYVPGANPQNSSELRFKLASGNLITYLNGNKSYSNGLAINVGEALVINNTATPASTVIDVQGDFSCKGDLDIWDTATTVRFNISGNATLGCSTRFSTNSPSNNLIFVVKGAIKVIDGFSSPATGHVIVTDSADLVKSADSYIADSTSDDGVTPTIMPTSDTKSIKKVPAETKVSLLDAGNCQPGAHQLNGRFSPPANRRFINQGSDEGLPVVLAVWLKCDVVVNGITVDPPVWANPPASERADAVAKNGRKGAALNLYSAGKITFTGDSVFTLMDGGNGQDKKSILADPAVATGGKGGESGDLKIAAAGGIDLSNGTLRIIPGRGGNGGNAYATGKGGSDGCPGKTGAAATATGGAGADSKKVLVARGFDPAGKVSIGNILGGTGGTAEAIAGYGGDGTPGKCDGGAGGNASAQAGKGGDSTFTYKGIGNGPTPPIFGGDGGAATATSGHGGNGGNASRRCDPGGDGGKGGTSTARSGIAGTGATLDGNNGSANASNGNGDGGVCGFYNSGNGSGGTWTEYTRGILQNSGRFNDGKRDCSCTIALVEPKISVTPGEVIFDHNYGVSSCPQQISQVSITNAGSGSFSWQLGSLPTWLSASKTSGTAGDTNKIPRRKQRGIGGVQNSSS